MLESLLPCQTSDGFDIQSDGFDIQYYEWNNVLWIDSLAVPFLFDDTIKATGPSSAIVEV
jgi:hypothetical protein